MAAQVLSFFQRSPRYAPAPADWSQQELAEFYRVEGALIRAGIRVSTDRGLSDENEPWFVFYRSDDGEVVIHFARIDGEYLIAGPAYEEIARGLDFSALVRNMVARHPMVRRSDSNDNILLHPAALLVAVVGTAFFKTGEARAAETGATNAPQAPANRPALLSSSSGAALKSGVAPMAAAQPSYDTVQLPANQAVLILAAALLASDYGVSAPSIDPAAHTAISAAAAALDFSGAPTTSGSGDSAPPLSGASHVAAVDSAPEHMVSSVLSLVALLSTRPSLDTAASGVEHVSIAGVVHQDAQLSSPTARLPADPANWSLDVRLTPGVLPTVEAVQLVRGVIGDANIQKISVIEVSQLPDVLADLISRGAHYTTTPTATQTQPAATEPATTPPAGEGDSHGAGATGVTAPASGELAKPAVTPLTETFVSKPPPQAAPVYASLDLAKQFVDYFINHTDHFSIMMQGQKVVMYDDRVLHDAGSIDHVTSVNFDFFDGTSINLVGAHSAFLNDGILV